MGPTGLALGQVLGPDDGHVDAHLAHGGYAVHEDSDLAAVVPPQGAGLELLGHAVGVLASDTGLQHGLGLGTELVTGDGAGGLGHGTVLR